MISWIIKGLQFVYNYRNFFNLFVRKPQVEVPPTMEEVAVASYNRITKKNGIRSVDLSEILSVCAKQHAEWMRIHNKLSHVGALGRTARERAVMAGYKGIYIAENIFTCNECDGHSAVQSLMRTINARGDTIENFTDFGIGQSGRYWCVILGR